MIRLKTAAIIASIMVTTTVTACAGDLTAVRVSDYDGASRIVFDMTELPLSWTKSYNANQNTVTLKESLCPRFHSNTLLLSVYPFRERALINRIRLVHLVR